MDVVSLVESHLVASLGEVRARASVTFVGCEPLEVLRFDAPGGATYATLGMSRNPMLDPTDPAPDPVRGPRAELVVTLAPADDRVLRPLAIAAMTPTVDGVVVSDGITLDMAEPLWPGSQQTGFVVGEPTLVGLALPAPADPVRFFPLTPLTPQELAIAREVRVR
jgi:hypothetical protein